MTDGSLSSVANGHRSTDELNIDIARHIEVTHERPLRFVSTKAAG